MSRISFFNLWPSEQIGIEKGKFENLNRFYEAMNIEEHKSMNRKNYIKCDYFT